MGVWSRWLMGILLLLSMGLAACTGTDLSGTAGEVGDDGQPAAAVAGDEGEDDAVGEGEGEEEGEDDAVGEAGGEGDAAPVDPAAGEEREDDGAAEAGDEGESDAVGEGAGDEAVGTEDEPAVGAEGGAEGAEDDAVGEGAGEGEDDAVDEAGDVVGDLPPPAPVANAQAALDALEAVRFDTMSWRDLGDQVDRDDLAALRAYFDALSRAELAVPDCERCLDTINVLLGGQAARIDDVRGLLDAIIAGG